MESGYVDRSDETGPTMLLTVSVYRYSKTVGPALSRDGRPQHQVCQLGGAAPAEWGSRDADSPADVELALAFAHQAAQVAEAELGGDIWRTDDGKKRLAPVGVARQHEIEPQS